jgi:transcriptional regulator with XRE-family HTH domain
MSGFGSPAERRLATELRRLRRQARMLGKDVARSLGWSEAKLSRIEHGLNRVKLADLEQLVAIYGVPDPHRAELIALAAEPREAGPLEELEEKLPQGPAQFLRAESESQAMSNWEPRIVPGMLQLPAYTRAVLELWPATIAPAAEIERRVESTRLRQRHLARTPPLQLAVVIDESVLLRRFGSSAVMRDQLLHLAEMSEQPNIDVRVLAMSGYQVITTGAFVCFKFPTIHGVAMPDVVALEHLHGTTFIEAEAEVNSYQVAFRELFKYSLTPDETRKKLAIAAREPAIDQSQPL